MEKQIIISYKEYLELQNKVNRLTTQEINKEKELLEKALNITIRYANRHQVEERLKVEGIKMLIVAIPQKDNFKIILEKI